MNAMHPNPTTLHAADYPYPPSLTCLMVVTARQAENAPTSGDTMIDLNQIDDLARRLSDMVPPGLRESREELQATFKSALQAGLARLDLVTREEFDVQRAVLLRTREKLDALEKTVAALEATAQPPAERPAP
jgi:BMFP domain-containing protein YqiC